MPDDGRMRVTIRAPRAGDEVAYAEAVRRSAEHIGRWNPVEPDGLPDLLERQGPGLRTYLVVDRETGGLVGKVNVANIVMGRFCNGSLGYDSYLPFAGTGRMSEGMRLVLDRCFAPQTEGVSACTGWRSTSSRTTGAPSGWPSGWASGTRGSPRGCCSCRGRGGTTSGSR